MKHPRLTWAHQSNGLGRVCWWWQPWAAHSADAGRDLSRISPATPGSGVRFAMQKGGCTGAATAIPGGLQFPRSCGETGPVLHQLLEGFPREQGKNRGPSPSLLVVCYHCSMQTKSLVFDKLSLGPTNLAWSSVQLSLVLPLQLLK